THPTGRDDRRVAIALGVTQEGDGAGLFSTDPTAEHTEATLPQVAAPRVARDHGPRMAKRVRAAFEREVVRVPHALAGADPQAIADGVQRARERRVHECAYAGAVRPLVADEIGCPQR